MSLGLGAKALIRMPKPALIANLLTKALLRPATKDPVIEAPARRVPTPAVMAPITTALKVPLKLRPIRILPN